MIYCILFPALRKGLAQKTTSQSSSEVSIWKPYSLFVFFDNSLHLADEYSHFRVLVVPRDLSRVRPQHRTMQYFLKKRIFLERHAHVSFLTNMLYPAGPLTS